MKVIWKRPDGYHNASPTDYTTLDISSHSRIWLHKDDQDWYPFRVSGGWADEESTQRLNKFTHFLNVQPAQRSAYLTDLFHHSKEEDGAIFLANSRNWIDGLRPHLKGDTWEVDIMSAALSRIMETLQDSEAEFLKTIS